MMPPGKGTVFKNIPDDYGAFPRGEITIIAKRGFERVFEREDWRRPGAVLAKYSSEKIGSGRGRVAVLEVEGGKKIFLKKMLHGGLFGALFGDAFVKGRIINNLRNAAALTDRAIGSPGIVAILLRRKFLSFFEGYVVEEMIEDAENLIHIVRSWREDARADRRREELLREVASHIRDFHEKGFYHHDLNAGNILIRTASGGTYEVFFVDLDTVRRSMRTGRMRRMQNIFRLFRSLRKWAGTEHFSDSDEERFIGFYCVNDAKMLSLMNAFLPLYRFSLLFHILSWKLASRS